MDLYDELFRGRLYRLQRSAKKDGKVVKILSQNPRTPKLYNSLAKTVGKLQTKTKAMNLGIPVLGSYQNNWGSYEFSEEFFTFLNDQDETILGTVPKGTRMKRMVGMYHKSQSTTGVLSKHKARSERFSVTRDHITLPESYRPTEYLDPIPSKRLVAEFVYTFKKNDWSEGNWTEELKELSSAIGYRGKIFEAMEDERKDNREMNFAGIEARLKISKEALYYLRDWVMAKGTENSFQVFKSDADQLIREWLANPENFPEELCGGSQKCFTKLSKETHKSLGEAVKFMSRVSGNLLKEADHKKDKFVIRSLLTFGKLMTKSQFTLAVLMKRLQIARGESKENDFAFCVRWKGSSFRQGELVLFSFAH